MFATKQVKFRALLFIGALSFAGSTAQGETPDATPAICDDPVGAAWSFAKSRAAAVTEVKSAVRAQMDKAKEDDDGEIYVPQSKVLELELRSRMPAAPDLISAIAAHARGDVSSIIEGLGSLAPAIRTTMLEDLKKTTYQTPLEAHANAELAAFPALDMWSNTQGLYSANLTGYRSSTETPSKIAITGNRWVTLSPWFPILAAAGNVPSDEWKPAIYFILAHEFTHSVDSIKNFAAFNLCDSKSTAICRNYTPAWIPWLDRMASRYESQFIKDGGAAASELDLGPIYGLARGEMPPNPNTVTLWAESQADLIAALALSKSELFLKLNAKQRTRAVLLALGMLLPEEGSDPYKKDGEEGHPHGFERIEYLVANQPELRKALGCSGEAKFSWIGP